MNRWRFTGRAADVNKFSAAASTSHGRAAGTNRTVLRHAGVARMQAALLNQLAGPAPTYARRNCAEVPIASMGGIATLFPH
jgi:hypothetical protein